MRRLLPAACGLVTVLLSGPWLLPQASHAHGIESSLQRFGGLQASVESHFSSGLPARDARVRLLPPDGGAAIELGRTDASGRLGFALPARADGSWEVQVDAGSGHRDWIELGEGKANTGQGPQAVALPTGRLHPALGWSSLAGLGLFSGLAMLERRRRHRDRRS
jgi:nickel transport protein